MEIRSHPERTISLSSVEVPRNMRIRPTTISAAGNAKVNADTRKAVFLVILTNTTFDVFHVFLL